MEIPVFTVDAFANLCFQGNPAAICPLKRVSVRLRVLPGAEARNLRSRVTTVFPTGAER